MGIPQVIVIILYAMSLGVMFVKNGEPKEGTYSFWSAFISVVILFGCFWWGGFFG